MSREIFLSSKKDRVKGKGPNRSTLPNFHYVRNIGLEIQQEVLEIIDTYRDTNDNYIDDHSISKFCDLGEKFPKNHTALLLLQKPRKNSNGMNEKDYTTYDKLKSNSLLKKAVFEKVSKML